MNTTETTTTPATPETPATPQTNSERYFLTDEAIYPLSNLFRCYNQKRVGGIREIRCEFGSKGIGSVLFAGTGGVYTKHPNFVYKRFDDETSAQQELGRLKDSIISDDKVINLVDYETITYH